MSGKYTKKKSKNSRVGLVVVIVIIALVAGAFAWALTRSESEQEPTQTPSETSTTAEQNVQTDDQPTDVEADPTETEAQPTENGTQSTEKGTQSTQPTQGDGQQATTGGEETPTKPVQIEELESVSVNLGSGLAITDVGKYTGVYMEDGTDEVITGIMMIAVTNEGDQDVQYAEISLPVGNQIAHFTLTTLPAGGTVILLEQNRMPYLPDDYTTAVVENVVLFKEPLSLCEDRIRIEKVKEGMNVTNISGKDMDGDIYIYYKNSARDVYYGGITYRVRLDGGLKAGETRQVVSNHYSLSGTAVMFVTCGEN